MEEGKKTFVENTALTRFTFPVVIERDNDGYFAYCPSLQGCYAQGHTYEEALAN